MCDKEAKWNKSARVSGYRGKKGQYITGRMGEGRRFIGCERGRRERRCPEGEQNDGEVGGHSCLKTYRNGVPECLKGTCFISVNVKNFPTNFFFVFSFYAATTWQHLRQLLVSYSY